MPLRLPEILFEDDECLILNKPAGLAVQGGAGLTSSLDEILFSLRDPRPLLVHRLDKETSGVILTAKNREAAARFSALFSRREEGTAAGSQKELRKFYIAVCAGRPPAESGYIRTDLDIKGTVKKAETAYRLISTGVLLETEKIEYAALELEPGTGRLHQIRRHLASIGCPILGDDKYGNFALNKTLRKSRGLKRLLLHAARLVISGKSGEIDVSAPLPEAFGPFMG
jgi:23S rRNA pseudouridine955/2504/2580 synthase